jgi:hypothetical protein
MEFEGFQVTNYRNIIDSGWINANRITSFVGQNEAGKSNLFEALYILNPIIPGSEYSLDEDWPVDRWEVRKDAKGKLVCKAKFKLNAGEIGSLADAALVAEDVEEGQAAMPRPTLPSEVSIRIDGAAIDNLKII